MRTFITFALLLVASTTFAIQPPPSTPDAQREWLTAHVTEDAKALGTFGPNVGDKVESIVYEMGEKNLGLACQFYYLTRAKTEQDAGSFAAAQAGDSAKLYNDDLTSEMNSEAIACYDQLVAVRPYLARVIYCSVPGWCVNYSFACPDWYFGDDSYLGCCGNGDWCGDWGAAVYGAWCDQSGYWGSSYYPNLNSFYAHSIRVATNRGRWYHNHDWHSHLNHDHMAHVAHHAQHAAQHVARTTHAAHATQHANHAAHAATHAAQRSHATQHAARASAHSAGHARASGHSAGHSGGGGHASGRSGGGGHAGGGRHR